MERKNSIMHGYDSGGISLSNEVIISAVEKGAGLKYNVFEKRGEGSISPERVIQIFLKKFEHVAQYKKYVQQYPKDTYLYSGQIFTAEEMTLVFFHHGSTSILDKSTEKCTKPKNEERTVIEEILTEELSKYYNKIKNQLQNV